MAWRLNWLQSLTSGVTLALMAAGPVRAQELSTREIAARATPATVTHLTFDAGGDTLGLGSGFLVADDRLAAGTIATNYHVVAGARRAVAVFANGTTREVVALLATDSVADLALLLLDPTGLPAPLPLGPPAPPAVGEKVVAIGSPFGLAQTVTEGIVSAYRPNTRAPRLQVSAAISPGSSGGPVLDTRGRVVGVTASYLAGGQQLNFAVPVAALRALAAPSRWHASAFGPPTSPTRRPARAVVPSRRPQTAGAGRPAPTRTPVPSLTGTYALAAEAYKTDWGLLLGGILVLTGDGSGWVVTYWPDSIRAAREGEAIAGGRAEGVYHSNTAPDGRVALELLGIPFDGYQTENGLYVEGTWVDTTGGLTGLAAPTRYPIRITLVRTNWALSYPAGLYTATCRTKYVAADGTESPQFTDWSGSLGVVVVRDSIFIDITLGNAQGGITGGMLSGPFEPATGRFSVTGMAPGGPQSLTGTLETGILEASWSDQRDTGRFAGHLSARRQ